VTPAIRARPDSGALRMTGMVQFSAAGLATVQPGRTSVTLTPRVSLSEGMPNVFVTVQSSGGTFKRVGIKGTQLTLYLTKAATAPVRLAYFIVSRPRSDRVPVASRPPLRCQVR
jgi:hypothetical protein